MRNFTHRWHFQHFFLKSGHFFPIFEKGQRAGETPLPPLDMRLIKNSVIWKANTNKDIISYSKSSAKQQYVVKYIT